MNTKSGDIEVNITPRQQQLVQEKLEVLQKARDLQTELARIRAEITRIDQEMIRADFRIPVVASW